MQLFDSDLIAPTPKDTVFEEGTAELYRFRADDDTRQWSEGDPLPVLLVPSLINRWYVMDLKPTATLAGALVERELDTWCLDWGIPNDEDRYLSWEDIVSRIGRMIRRVKRRTGAPAVSLLGYCMGGTLCAIYTALEGDDVAAFVNLTGPIDFSEGGLLSRLVDEEWFDAEAITAAGNLPAPQMQSGFVALRPTGQISKWVLLADRADDEAFVEGFKALETWVGDNIPFPAEAYVTYIEELYQQNRLFEGDHWVDGRRVELSDIDVPLLTIAAQQDNICPEPAATALNEMASSPDATTHVVPGGHVGAVVGSKAPESLYPKIGDWLAEQR
jgi:polyhydroxyalkanoate synthase